MKKIASVLKERLGESRWLLPIGLLGVLLLLLSPYFGEKKSADPVSLDTEKYRKDLTLEVETLCERVEGAGDCSVLLTLESGTLAVYEKNESASGKTVATVGGEALCLGYEMPRVAGVAVVAEGGGSDEVKHALTSLLSSALHLSCARISISASR